MDSIHFTLSMYYDYDAHVKGELLVMMKNSQSVNLLIFISNTLIELFNDFGFDCDGMPKDRSCTLNLWSYKVVRYRYSNPMIQPEPEGSTKGYPVDSIEVFRDYKHFYRLYHSELVDIEKEPLPPLLKLIGAEPAGTSNSLTSLADLTLNMADLTLDTFVPKKTKPISDKVSPMYVIKKMIENKSLVVPNKKADLSTEQLLFTLMEEVKGLKRQIEIPSGTSPSNSHSSSSKSTKQKTWFGPCKHCTLRNHITDDCYSKPKCSTCGSTYHLTKEHIKQTTINKTLTKLKAQSSMSHSTKNALMIPKPFKACKYYGFNDHHSVNCEYYPGCEVCGSIAHEPVDCPKRHPNSRNPRIAKRSTEHTEKYSKELGPKVVFGDDSSGDTKGYGSVNCNGITFTRVAHVNGLKHNLISISQLCDANFKVLFTKNRGAIFNQNDEVVLIAPEEEMSMSLICYLSIKKAIPVSLPKLLQGLISSGNFKNINNLAKHNLISGLPSLTFTKDKNCSACEKGKHHRASFKRKRSFSINKSLHLLHMDLFGPVKPQTISHNKYTLVIIDNYLRKMENLNEVRIKELRSDNKTEFKNHKREEFCDEKAVRTMLNSIKLPKQFWGEATNTACYTQNRSIIVKRHRKTAYDVFRGRSHDISYFHVFGCPMHIHNHRDHLGKFNEKADDGFFLGYSLVAKAFRDFVSPKDPHKWSREKHIELVNIIGEPLAGITTRSRVKDSDVASAHECLYVNFLSKMEPKKLIEALEEEGLEAIRIFLAYATYMDFMVYQMDMKSAFLNGKISEEVYVQQPPRFETVNFAIMSDFKGISICQEKYVKDLLKKYDLNDSASVKCPMLPLNNLGSDELGVSVNETLFRCMIGSVMYLIASRPDIRFSTCLCARYQANPKESHFVAVKRIFRYLKGTPNLGLEYPKGSGFDLKTYSNSDYAGCNLDRRTEAEYVVVAACCAQVLWIKSQLADYDVLYDKGPIFCDNTSAIAISNNPVLHSRTKHIDIGYHFIRDHILKGDVELHFVPTDLQLADIFTKPLAEPSFTRLVAELGMLNIQNRSDKKKALSDL
ncbi:retrovirus-related pol polyprotein from transposon TNT 1-94 [Tanacetum coccineum]